MLLFSLGAKIVAFLCSAYDEKIYSFQILIILEVRRPLT